MLGNNLSLSDIAAVTNGNNDGFGGNNGWWILIILFAIFGGWGNGWNNGTAGNGGGAATYGDLQRGFNQQTTDGMIRSLSYGIADSTYALNNAITGGFAAADLSRANQQAAVMAQLTSNAFAAQQQTNDILGALNNCCCQNREAIAQVRYDMATNQCATVNAINNASQNIILNDNANYRALHDEIVANKLEAKDARIAELTQQVNAMTLAASQQAQNNYIINQLRTPPVPAYIVQNPYTGATNHCCGYNA